MEKLKVKHDHTLTDILKVLIFAIVLLMPFLVYAPTGLYYAFNEHAQSTTTITEGGWEVQPMFETNQTNNTSNLINGNIYKFEYNNFSNFIIDDWEIYVKYVYYIDDNYNTEIELFDEEGYLCFHSKNGYCVVDNDYDIPIIQPSTEYIYIASDLWEDYSTDMEEYFALPNLITESDYIPKEYKYTEVTEVEKNITQMMEKNWNDLWNTNLFNWTNTSILKNGLDNFSQAFGITNTSHINNLITYELIMVGVYIVIDIVLTLFKWLTHMIGNK